jgi:hypothetical protein
MNMSGLKFINYNRPVIAFRMPERVTLSGSTSYIPCCYRN